MNMDEKRNRASKRKSMSSEEGYWDCSVCTYRNSPEAFKCEICDVRKGTSTRSGRKPRINPAVVMQQVGQQVFTPPLKKEKKEGSTSNNSIKKPDPTGSKKEGDSPGPKEPSTSKENSPKSNTSSNKKNRAPRLKNIDRSSGRSMEVTVGNVTVVITDYQPKKPSETSSESSVASAGKVAASPNGAGGDNNSTTSNTSSGSTTAAGGEEKTDNNSATSVMNGEEAAIRDES